MRMARDAKRKYSTCKHRQKADETGVYEKRHSQIERHAESCDAYRKKYWADIEEELRMRLL